MLDPPTTQTSKHEGMLGLPGSKYEGNNQKGEVMAQPWIRQMTFKAWLLVLIFWTPVDSVGSTKHSGNWKTLYKGGLLIFLALAVSSILLLICTQVLAPVLGHLCVHFSPILTISSFLLLWSWNWELFSTGITIKTVLLQNTTNSLQYAQYVHPSPSTREES